MCALCKWRKRQAALTPSMLVGTVAVDKCQVTACLSLATTTVPGVGVLCLPCAEEWTVVTDGRVSGGTP